MKRFIALLLAALFLLCGCTPTESEISDNDGYSDVSSTPSSPTDVPSSAPSDEEISQLPNDGSVPETPFLPDEPAQGVDLSQIPSFSGDPFVVIDDNAPNFTAEDIVYNSYEFYSELDSLGRCGYTMACIGRDIMPTEDRGSIGSVKPTGWHTVKYDNVDGKYLYNRCHLIGFQLTGENANLKNLITGTRYMNVEGMLPFENMVADYVKETGNHVLYRVTPIFDGEDLLARGVQMEAYSLEDNGEGICFNVFCYNAQPDISIDYATGESKYAPGEAVPDVSYPDDYSSEGSGVDTPDGDTPDSNDITYILNTNSKKFHYPNCHSADKISEKNRKTTSKSRDELIAEGYSPCGNCDP